MAEPTMYTMTGGRVRLPSNTTIGGGYNVVA